MSKINGNMVLGTACIIAYVESYYEFMVYI